MPGVGILFAFLFDRELEFCNEKLSNRLRILTDKIVARRSAQGG